MADKPKFDIINDNFDEWFSKKANQMTEAQRSELPKELSFKLFRSGIVTNQRNTSKLSFLQKLYVLVRSLKKRWFLIIEDEENGITFEQFVALKKEIKERELTISNSQRQVDTGGFILGDKELMDTYSYLNVLNVSTAYKYALQGKNSKTDMSSFKDSSQYMVDFLINYEQKKKIIVANYRLKTAELYSLYYFYDGKEKQGSELYTKVFNHVFNANKAQFIHGCAALVQRGYLERFGKNKFTSLRITALGKSVCNEILSKHILNQ